MRALVVFFAMILFGANVNAQYDYNDEYGTSSDGPDRYFYDENFDWRWDIRVRISDGADNGSLTRREADRLYNKLERIEIHGAVGFVGIPIFENILHHFYLFRDVAGSARLDAGWQCVENAHHVVETHGILLRHLHGLQLIEAGPFGHAVFAVVEQVAYVGDVAHIAHAVADVQQIAINDIETDKSAAVAEVYFVINRRAADIHAYMAVLHGAKSFFLSCGAVVQLQVVLHFVGKLFNFRLQAASLKRCLL